MESFSKLKVMIVGDVMIDSYIFGKVDRISPEAPVPVVHITGRENRPGGAANVAINVQSLGATPLLCSVTGDDEAGNKFNTLLSGYGIGGAGILRSVNQKTTVKTRVIGNNHQLLRVDDENISNLVNGDEQNFIKHCISIIEKEKPDVILFEDYDKGVITAGVIESVTSTAKKYNIPVTADPKKKNFNLYRHVTLFKPNLHELCSGLGITIEKPTLPALKNIAAGILGTMEIDMLMVTLSEAGVFIATGDSAELIPAHVRSISDVSGAGDTVITVASLCLAAGIRPGGIARLANLAGGLVCEEVGVVPINKNRFIAEIENNPAILDSL